VVTRHLVGWAQSRLPKGRVVSSSRSMPDGFRSEPREETPGELLHRAAAGDRAAWPALVRRFERLVMHAARRVGLTHSEAADVAQLTWIRLIEHAHQIREPDRLPAWLTATARREGLRVAVAAKRYVLCADPAVEHGSDRHLAVTDEYSFDGEYEPEIERALARLPVRYQRLIRLLMSDDCPSYTEIARELDLPIGSIGPMRMRALQMLRRTPEFAAAPGTRITAERETALVG
jgi:RNA polymerase sigma factor (sigma-70 family)